jgi:hypothetical protein
MGDDGKITCIKPGTQLKINYLHFSGGLAQGSELHNHVGTPVTITLMRSAGRHYTADVFELEGYRIHIEYLARGITAHIPRKVRSDKGKTKPRNLDKVLALDQVRAEVQLEPDALTAEKNAEYDDYIREFARDAFAEHS